jgi:hypothetical protein
MTLSNLTELPAWFLQTKPGQQIVTEITQQTLEQRRALVAEIAEIRAAAVRESRRLAEEFDKAEGRVREAKATLREAEKAYGQALQAKLGYSHQVSGEIARREQKLRDTADPAIETFLSELQQREEDICRGVLTVEMAGKRNIVTDKRQPVVYSNAPSSTAALQALREARAAAQALKLEPFTAQEVQNRLAALRETIPAVTEETIR